MQFADLGLAAAQDHMVAEPVDGLLVWRLEIRHVAIGGDDGSITGRAQLGAEHRLGCRVGGAIQRHEAPTDRAEEIDREGLAAPRPEPRDAGVGPAHVAVDQRVRSAMADEAAARSERIDDTDDLDPAGGRAPDSVRAPYHPPRPAGTMWRATPRTPPDHPARAEHP